MRLIPRPAVSAPSCLLLVLVLAMAALAACAVEVAGGSTPSAEDDGGATGGAPRLDVVRFGVVGDSLTAGAGGPVGSTDVGGATSWVPAADVPPLQLRGGWAVPGARTSDMRAGVEPLDADVLVVMGGTNDVQGELPWGRSRDELLDIVATAGVAEVVVSAIPPLDRFPMEARQYNEALQALAGEQGWEYVDPWSGIATAQGTWAAGSSGDGIHPTQEVADLVGTRIRAAVLDSAQS